MPRNRQDVDRDVKVDEIVRVANASLRSGGYNSLSFKSIADELGLARGAVYWYFRSKDELLVAVVAKAYSEALADPPTRAGYLKRILWAVEKLADLQPLTSALHERAQHSDQLAELQEMIQREMCARLREVLRQHVDEDRLESVAQAIVVFVQGLLALPLTKAERERQLGFLVSALVGPSDRFERR